jgi:hypothetical protein
VKANHRIRREIAMDEKQVARIARDAAREVELKSLLLTVKHQGVASLPKKHLLWLLGERKYENWQAWALLLDAWETLDEPRDTLYGTYDGPRITLISGKPYQLSTTWAESGKAPVLPEAKTGAGAALAA